MQAYADNGKVSDILEGQPAPFTGVIMTNDVATKLYLDSKFSPKQCEIKIGEKLEIADINCKAQIDLLNAKIKIENDRFEKIIEAKDDRIHFLEKRWSPRPWYDTGVFWMSVGVISGILITAVAGYSISNVSR